MQQGIDADSRTWGMLCHLSRFAGYLIPFGNIIGPLICWLAKREQMPFVDHHGKEALNFQLSITLYAFICIPLMFIFVGFFLIVLVVVLDLIFTIIAAVKANGGEYYAYPMTIRFIK